MGYTGNMVCPDCGGKLIKIGIVGVDNSFRCEKCGGVWVMGWVINQIAEDGQLKIFPKGSTAVQIAGGKMPMCPEDQLVMSGQSGEELPPELPVWKCGKCGWWWLPGDTVFELKAAYDAKREYAKRWKKPSPFKTFALPVILSVLFIVGLVVGNKAMQQRSLIKSQAAGIDQLTVMYKESGRAEVKFVSRVNIETIVYRLQDAQQWQMATVVKQGDVSVVEIEGVSPGDSLWLSIGQEVRQVTVGEKQ